MQQVTVLAAVSLILLIFPVTVVSPNSAYAQPSESTTSEFLTYENAEAGVSIEYPSDWMVFETDPLNDPTFVAAFAPQDAEFVDLAIHMEDVPEGTTLQAYTTAGLQIIKDIFPDAEITSSSSEDMTLSGNPAHVVTFNVILDDGTSSIMTQVWTLSNDKGYVITYRASSDEHQAFTDVIDRMISSFQITQASSSSASNEPTNATSSNTTTTTIAGNASDFESARQELLSAWQQTPFNATFSTYIEAGSDQGYGIYTEHRSNIFTPEDTVELYLEPVGFIHNPVLGEQGEELYQINLTASVQITQNSTTSPEAATSINQTISDIPPVIIVSHKQNTEVFMTIPVYLYQSDPPLPEGDYIIAYTITDGESGQSFTIEKQIRIAQTVYSSSA